MNVLQTKLLGVRILEPKTFIDSRGQFIKVFNKDKFLEAGMKFDLQESYYSTSKKNVIRGMHFQIPPKDHAKLVYVTNGIIMDVVLDIRRGSPTYGQHITVDLNDQNHRMIFIPPGFAHGFLSLTDGSTVTYLQTTMHSPDHDCGIHINSFGLDWGVKNPVTSQRDQAFLTLAEFKSPFTYHPTTS